MKFEELDFEGVFKIELEKILDNRGFFARSWDKREFEKNGLDSEFVQCNISQNQTKGTIRGLHFQAHPYEEAKFVRCTKGKVFEVFIDLREESKTFCQWGALEMDSKSLTCLYVPKGFGLGFQTLEDDTELFYQMSQYYNPESSRGIIWNDKKLKIDWPINLSEISKKDLSLPKLEDALKEIKG